jgi:ferredoxin
MVEINQETCKRCGLCADACSAKIIMKVDGRYRVSPQPDWDCIECGLCMAVCPTKSIKVPSLKYEDMPTIPRGKVNFDSFYNMILPRRSIRSYKKDAVPKDVLKSITDAAATAPMGVPPSKVEVVVFDRRSDIESLLDNIAKGYEGFLSVMKNPIIRGIFRLVYGGATYHNFKNHVVPAARIALDWRKRGRDCFSYDAPAMMLFHGSRFGESIFEDCWIAATYASLAAHFLGLGTCFIGMIPPIVDRDKKLKRRLGIAEENRVIACLLLGYPGIKFKRVIPRELGGVKYTSKIKK